MTAGDSFRPYLLTDGKILYILEFTVGFETNIQINSDRKAAKYMINDLFLSYSEVVFVNLSMGAIGVMGSSCNSLLSLPHEFHHDYLYSVRLLHLLPSKQDLEQPRTFKYFISLFLLRLLLLFLFHFMFYVMLSTSKPTLHCNVLERCTIVFS